jgi:ureidoglycolate hydrolase
MPVGAPGGDLLVSARPAAPESFAPFGRLLSTPAQVRMGRKGGVILSLEAGRPGPRRLTHVVRYPLARRAVFSMGPVSLIVVVFAAGERPEGPPLAFRTQPGTGLLLHAGIWHHGPVALADVDLLEALETPGAADRMDRCALKDALGTEAVRVTLPEEADALPRG